MVYEGSQYINRFMVLKFMAEETFVMPRYLDFLRSSKVKNSENNYFTVFDLYLQNNLDLICEL